MIDPEAVAVSVIGSTATANPDEDYKTNLPMTIVETITSYPLDTGPDLDACNCIIQLTTIDSTRESARSSAWAAHEALVRSPGTAMAQGAVTYARGTQLPFQQRNDSYATEDKSFYVFVSAVGLIVQSTI